LDHNQTKKLFENWALFLNEAEALTPEKFEEELEKLVLIAKSKNPDPEFIMSRLQVAESFVREMNDENSNNEYDTIFYSKKQEISDALRENDAMYLRPRRKGPSIGVDRTSYRPGARKKTKEIERMQGLDKAAKLRLQLHGTGTTYDLENRKKIAVGLVDSALFILGLEDAEDFDSIDWAFWVATWVIPVGFVGKFLGAVFKRGARQAAQQAKTAGRRLGKMAAKDKRLIRRARSQQSRANRRFNLLRKSPAFRFISSATKSKIYKLAAFVTALSMYIIALEWMEKTLRGILYDEDDPRSRDYRGRKELEEMLKQNEEKLRKVLEDRQAVENFLTDSISKFEKAQAEEKIERAEEKFEEESRQFFNEMGF